jgi:hypothetical protein
MPAFFKRWHLVMLAWRLEDFDNVIIVVLLVFLLITLIWRVFFRWDTRFMLVNPGARTGACITFNPPFPRADNATIAVISSKSRDPRDRCTWLVQGLLAAGYQVSLARDTRDLELLIAATRVAAIIHHGLFTRGTEILATITVAAMHNVPRVVLVNNGGTKGIQSIRAGINGAHKIGASAAVEISMITEAKRQAFNSDQEKYFAHVLVVHRSRGHLADAELLVVASLILWIG